MSKKGKKAIRKSIKKAVNKNTRKAVKIAAEDSKEIKLDASFKTASGGAAVAGLGVSIVESTAVIVEGLTTVGITTSIAEAITTFVGVGLVSSGSIVCGVGVFVLAGAGAYKVSKWLGD